MVRVAISSFSRLVASPKDSKGPKCDELGTMCFKTTRKIIGSDVIEDFSRCSMTGAKFAGPANLIAQRVNGYTDIISNFSCHRSAMSNEM
jgi:hypothetical protein